MISMSFTGATLEEVAGHALTFAMLIGGAANARPTPGGEVSDATQGVSGPDKSTVAERVADATGSIEGAQRKRRTKAEMEQARAAPVLSGAPNPTAVLASEPAKTGEVVQFLRDAKAVTVEADPAATLFGEPVVITAPTFEDLKTALHAVVETEGKGYDAAKALMKSFGISRISALAECEWPKFIGDAKAICHVRA